ncbi:MAG: hypothetical protein H8E37_09150 [Planctomycetes bacterium]|nr:hypothetical protein [Planctomycetota bacterium]
MYYTVLIALPVLLMVLIRDCVYESQWSGIQNFSDFCCAVLAGMFRTGERLGLLMGVGIIVLLPVSVVVTIVDGQTEYSEPPEWTDEDEEHENRDRAADKMAIEPRYHMDDGSVVNGSELGAYVTHRTQKEEEDYANGPRESPFIPMVASRLERDNWKGETQEDRKHDAFYGILAGLILAIGFLLPDKWRRIFTAMECTSCKNPVPLSSRVGQTCPHCGVYWRKEEREVSESMLETSKMIRNWTILVAVLATILATHTGLQASADPHVHFYLPEVDEAEFAKEYEAKVREARAREAKVRKEREEMERRSLEIQKMLELE